MAANSRAVCRCRRKRPKKARANALAFPCDILGEIVPGVHRGPVDLYLEVAVIAGGAPCGTHPGDDLTLIDPVSCPYVQAGAVGIDGLETVFVVDDHILAVAPVALSLIHI